MIVRGPNPQPAVVIKASKKNPTQKAKDLLEQALKEGQLGSLLWSVDPELEKTQRQLVSPAFIADKEAKWKEKERERLVRLEEAQLLDAVAIWNRAFSTRTHRKPPGRKSNIQEKVDDPPESPPPSVHPAADDAEVEQELNDLEDVEFEDEQENPDAGAEEMPPLEAAPDVSAAPPASSPAPPEKSSQLVSGLEQKLTELEVNPQNKKGGRWKKTLRALGVVRKSPASPSISGATSDNDEAADPDASDVQWGGTAQQSTSRKQSSWALIQQLRGKRQSVGVPVELVAEIFQLEGQTPTPKRSRGKEFTFNIQQEDDELTEAERLAMDRRAALARVRRGLTGIQAYRSTRDVKFVRFWAALLHENDKRDSESYYGRLLGGASDSDEESDEERVDRSIGALSADMKLDEILEETMRLLFESKARSAQYKTGSIGLSQSSFRISPTSSQDESHHLRGALMREFSVRGAPTVALVVQRMKALGVLTEDSFRELYGLRRRAIKAGEVNEAKGQWPDTTDANPADGTVGRAAVLRYQKEAQAAAVDAVLQTPVAMDDRGVLRGDWPALEPEYSQTGSFKAPRALLATSGAAEAGKLNEELASGLDESKWSLLDRASDVASASGVLVSEGIYCHTEVPDGGYSAAVRGSEAYQLAPFSAEERDDLFLTSLVSVVSMGGEERGDSVMELVPLCGPQQRTLDPLRVLPSSISSEPAALQGRWGYDSSIASLSQPQTNDKKRARRHRRASKLTRRMSYPLHKNIDVHKEILFDCEEHSLLLVSYAAGEPVDCSEVHISSVFLTPSLFQDMLTLRTYDTYSVPSGYLGTFSSSQWRAIEEHINASLFEANSDQIPAFLESEDSAFAIPLLGLCEGSAQSVHAIPAHAIHLPNAPCTRRPLRQRKTVEAERGRFDLLLPTQELVVSVASGYRLLDPAPSTPARSVRATPRPHLLSPVKAPTVAEQVHRIGYEARGFVAAAQSVQITIHGRQMQVPHPPAKGKPVRVAELAAEDFANTQRGRIEAARKVIKYSEGFASPPRPAGPRAAKSPRARRARIKAPRGLEDLPSQTIDLEESSSQLQVGTTGFLTRGIKVRFDGEAFDDSEIESSGSDGTYDSDADESDTASESSQLSFMPHLDPADSLDCNVVLVVDARRTMQLYFTKKLLQLDSAVSVASSAQDAHRQMMMAPHIYGLVLISYRDLVACGDLSVAIKVLLPNEVSSIFYTVYVYDVELAEGESEDELFELLHQSGVEDVVSAPFTADALRAILNSHKRKLELRSDWLNS